MNPSTLSELITYARERQIGIGMFNIVNLEFAQAIFDAAQETGLPVMFGIPERFMQFYSVECMALSCRKLIEKSKVPMAIHLDHGKSLAGVMAALRAGFSSVMYDGSALPYEENVAQTRRVVEMAHALGVSVEGELGYVGRVGVDVLRAEGLTQPDQALDFVSRTGVDALAVAIGNQHGQYKGVPKLDFERLRAIRDRVDCGLVLHGGSGIGDEDFREAIHCGVQKVNIYTAMDTAARTFTQERFAAYSAYLDYTKDLTVVVKDVVARHARLFASAS